MNPSNNEKDSAVKAESLFKDKPTCFLCNSRLHLAYRCPITKLIRDNKIPIPLGFCIVHCEKISEKCSKKIGGGVSNVGGEWIQRNG